VVPNKASKYHEIYFACKSRFSSNALAALFFTTHIHFECDLSSYRKGDSIKRLNSFSNIFSAFQLKFQLKFSIKLKFHSKQLTNKRAEFGTLILLCHIYLYKPETMVKAILNSLSQWPTIYSI